MFKRGLRQIRNIVGRLRFFFQLGHNRWFVFALSLIQFALIIFTHYWEKLPNIPNVLSRFEPFLLVFILTYIPTAVMFGYFEARKGTYRSEALAQLEYNPVTKKLFDELYHIRKELRELKKSE